MADELETPGQPADAPAQEAAFELDPRFKSVEDQARAYKEAEKKMTQEAQRRADLERQNRELLSRPQQVVAPQDPQPQEDLNELYWQKPAAVVERILERYVAPFVDNGYEGQKQKYASDPNFQRFAPQIDQMVQMQPELKRQPGIVDKLYRVARAMEFDPDQEREALRAEVRAEIQGKQAGLAESPSAPQGGTQQTNPANTLTADERRVALKFHNDVAPEEAYKRYAASKDKWAQGAF
jgi:hypothetical protein